MKEVISCILCCLTAIVQQTNVIFSSNLVKDNMS